MKINLSLKYWGKHKLRAFTIIFAIAVSMAALTCVTFLIRSSSLGEVERFYLDYSGDYDFHIIDISKDELERYQNDERFTETGVLYRGGTIKASGSTEFVYGALTESAVPLYHFTLEDGRYPENSGEITATRTFFETMGCFPQVGDTIKLPLRDFDGNVTAEREFAIVGVIWDQDYPRTIVRDYSYDYVLPQAFLWSGDMPENAELNLLANSFFDENLNSVRAELRANNVDFYAGRRIQILTVAATIDYDRIVDDLGEEGSEESLYNNLKYAYKDRYTQRIIPAFSAVTLLVAFVSICNVISTSLSERRKQLAMLRCIGMGKRRVLLMAISEALSMVIVGIAAGFPLGIGGYALTLFVQKNLLGLHIYPAYTVSPLVAAITVDPYIYPAVICSTASFLAVLIPYIIELRRSPVEGLSDKPKTTSGFGLRLKGKAAVLGRISSGFKQSISFVIIVIAVSWSAVFGYAYFLAQSAFESKELVQALETSQLAGLDYAAQRSEFLRMGPAQLNRHHLGITPELAAEVSEYKDTELFFASIEARSTKAVYDPDKVKAEIVDALSSANTDCLTKTGLEELAAKTRLTQGYLENELLFNIPTVGVPADTLDMLSEFIIEGNYNKEKLLSGEEILILNTSKSSPYSVGDVIPMTDIVIEDEAAEMFYFGYGGVPEGAKPSFYHSYSDDPTNYQWEGYAFGKRQDYTVRVGGIVDITDEDILSFFRTPGLVDSSIFNILCADSAFEAWGLPDKNYTKIGVKLSDKANIDDFELLWYKVVGNSEEVSSSSVSAIKRQMNGVTSTNMSIFTAIIITVVILGLVGIVNSVNLRVRRGLRSYSTLRAVGLSKKGLIALIMRQGLICAVIGAVTSLIPLGVYEHLRIISDDYISNVRFFVNGKVVHSWHLLYPPFLVWNQPIFLIICGVLLAVCAVILISNIIPARWIAKKNITEALRNDDF